MFENCCDFKHAILKHILVNQVFFNFLSKLFSGECHRTLLVKSENNFRKWPGGHYLTQCLPSCMTPHSITRAWFLIQICKISFSSLEMSNVLSLYNMSQMLLLVAVQAPSHYLVQWLPNRVMPNGTIRQQWVNSLWPGDAMWPLATGSGNRKLPVWQQAIKWTNVALLTIGHWGNGF